MSTVTPHACDLDKFAQPPGHDGYEYRYVEIPLAYDATLFRHNPKHSSSQPSLMVGTLADGSYARVLMHFGDVRGRLENQLPDENADATDVEVVCAEIGLVLLHRQHTPTVDLRPLLTDDWGARQPNRPDDVAASSAAAITRPAYHGEATWAFRRAPDVPWPIAPGGGNVDLDRPSLATPTLAGSGHVYYGGSKGGGTGEDGDGFIQFVQNEWIDVTENNNNNNKGLGLVARDEGESAAGYHMYKGSASNDPPKLMMVYRVPSTYPGPSSGGGQDGQRQPGAGSEGVNGPMPSAPPPPPQDWPTPSTPAPPPTHSIGGPPTPSMSFRPDEPDMASNGNDGNKGNKGTLIVLSILLPLMGVLVLFVLMRQRRRRRGLARSVETGSAFVDQNGYTDGNDDDDNDPQQKGNYDHRPSHPDALDEVELGGNHQDVTDDDLDYDNAEALSEEDETMEMEKAPVYDAVIS